MIDDKLFPPKQALAQVTGWDRQTFTTMEATRVLSRLGFVCQRAGQRVDGRPAWVREGRPDLEDHGPVTIEQRLSAAGVGVQTVGDLIERLSNFDSSAPVRVQHGLSSLAVALVADAAASASDIALIVSADSDLCPAIRTARSLNPGRRMLAAFPPRRSSFEIRSLIRKPFTLAAADIRNSLLPEVVADPASGLIHKRPGKWR